MATNSDFLTSQKNGVVATNGLTQSWTNYQRKSFGDNTSPCFSGPKTENDAATAHVAYTGSGNLVAVSVVDAGSSPGYIYDQAQTTNLDPATRLHAIPTTQGIMPAAFKFSSGLVVVPGTGQSVTLTYSQD